MIIKRESIKDKKIIYFFIFLLIVFFSILFITTSNFKHNLKNFILILSKEPFLSKKNSFEEILFFPNLIFNSFNSDKNFKTLFINIKIQDLKKIQKDRTKALSYKVLKNSSYVPITINFEGEKFKAKAKLKGILSGHWETSRQLSLKIKLENGKSIMGMREFSLTKHKERGFPTNQILSKYYSRIGIYTPDFHTFFVRLNGDDWGIMLAEEQSSSVYLERRNAKDSLIVKIASEEKLVSDNINYYNNRFIDTEIHKKVTKLFERKIFVYNSKKYLSSSKQNFVHNKHLYKIYNDLNDPNININEYLDLEKIIDSFALSLVWNEYHSLHGFNQRYYFNPFTSKLEIIPGDIGHNTFGKEGIDLSIHSIFLQDNEILNRVVRHDNFATLLKKSITKIKNNFVNFEKDLSELCKGFTTHCKEPVELSYIKYNLEYLSNNFDSIVTKLKLIANSFKEINLKNEIDKMPKKKLDHFIKSNDFLYVLNFQDQFLVLKNLSPLQIKIKNIELIVESKDENFDKIYFLEKDFNIDPSTYTTVKELKLDLKNFEKKIISKLKKNKKNNIHVMINYELKNIKKKYNQEVYDLHFLIDNKQNFSSEFLIKSFDKFVIKKGNWVIDKPLRIPKGYDLEIEAGTVMTFSNDSYIFIDGGTLSAIGNNDNKIIFTSSGKTWKGLFVRTSSSKKISKINYAIFENMTYYESNLSSLTGSLNFYNTNVEINNSIFRNSFAEDLLNLTQSKFKISNSLFQNTLSDAVDSDFSTGDITNTKFDQINGDALDTSGSVINVTDLYISDVKDKALSVGEKSHLNGTNIRIKKSKIGIASKDSSVVFIKSAKIENSLVADLMTYQKKYIYSEGKIYIENFNISKNKIFSESQNNIFLKDIPINNILNVKSNKKYPFFFDEYIGKLNNKN